MIGAAYLYAEGEGSAPNEIVLDGLINRYGVQAIMRRDYIGAGEINRMSTVRRVVDAYRARAAHANAATWATENKSDNALLIQAWRAAYE